MSDKWKVNGMVYLQRSKIRPNLNDLDAGEQRLVQEHFNTNAGDVIVDGQAVGWKEIEEVEVATAARVIGPAGWIVRHVVHGDERYHVGFYFGRNEAVITNVSLDVARYIVQCVAYFAPLPILYSGPDGLVPVVEE